MTYYDAEEIIRTRNALRILVPTSYRIIEQGYILLDGETCRIIPEPDRYPADTLHHPDFIITHKNKIAAIVEHDGAVHYKQRRYGMQKTRKTDKRDNDYRQYGIPSIVIDPREIPDGQTEEDYLAQELTRLGILD